MTTRNEIMGWFSDELKERMNEDNLRPYHIAYFCGINPEDIGPYIDGEKLPDPWQLILLAENLSCTVNDLLGFGEVANPRIYEQFLASDMFLNDRSYAVCFADRLKVHIHNRDFSAEKLANETKISAPTIRKWMSNRPVLPRTMQLIRLCEALNCTPSDLLGY